MGTIIDFTVKIKLQKSGSRKWHEEQVVSKVLTKSDLKKQKQLCKENTQQRVAILVVRK